MWLRKEALGNSLEDTTLVLNCFSTKNANQHLKLNFMYKKKLGDKYKKIDSSLVNERLKVDCVHLQ